MRTPARAALLLLAFLAGCPKPAAPKVNRCEVDLPSLGLFKQEGSGASAAVLTSGGAIGGEGATARPGDVLMQNDLVRVVIEQPGRTVGPFLSGGGIVDADLVRSDGTGRDAFGRMQLIYSLGRISSVTNVEILKTGGSGGPAVVAATGKDVQHDLLTLKSIIMATSGLAVSFAVDPEVPVPLRTTTYYVLSPGENRVRALTAFCNDGDTPVLAPLIEMIDIGTFETFNPGGCANGLGQASSSSTDCLLEKSRWVAAQANGVAYGLRTYTLADLTKPAGNNVLLSGGGVFGEFIEGNDLQSMLTWADPSARTRPGTFQIRKKAQRLYLRDLVIAPDIAGVSSSWLAFDGATTGTVNVTATLPGGAPAAGARVAVVDGASTMVTLVVADASGQGQVSLPPGDYTLTGSTAGRLAGPPVPVHVSEGGTTVAAVALADARTLTVNVADAAGSAVPAKVTLLCPGTCPFTKETWRQYALVDDVSGNRAAAGFVPPSGQLVLTVPPGEYDVVVSRGPEYATWPDTWPAQGHHVDLRQAGATVNAVIVPVVDSIGWMSADLHVHAANSDDSDVRNEVRVANFLAEGVDAIVSTDHEVITDFGPALRALGGERFMASMIGEEITTFTHGHFNAFPVRLRADLPNNGGAFDHAGGEDGPELRANDMFLGVKAEHPGSVVQINHPRGGSGALTLLKLDTATLATHGDPADYNMAPAPDATADDTRLFGDGFDAIETSNGTNPNISVLNDWMTFLSRGTVRTCTGVSDTHRIFSSEGGYARTYAKLGVDRPEDFSPAAFAEAIRGHHAFVTNGPFIRFTAKRLDGNGQPIGAPVDIGDTLRVGANESVELTVDVQGPEWMQLTQVELYSHAPGREAVNGEENKTWPDGRVLEKHTLDPLALPIEPVPGVANARRVHLTERFVAHPTADTWYVAMARGVGTRTMWPLHGAQPWAYTNAILVDADGSGAYDDFPLKPGHPLSVAPPARPVPRPLTRTELEGLLRALRAHHSSP